MAFNIVAGVNNALYGSVSGSGSYEEGAEVTLTVSPEDGYRFVSWDDNNTDNPRVFNASEDLTLIATLEAIPEYAVTLSANNDNLGTTSGSGNYREGSTATISASPSLHCRFVKWDDNNTDNPRSITVNSAVTLEAIFETVNWYSISTSVNDVTMGSVTGAGDYDEGDTVTLTAIANTDYKFVMWRDENTDNPRTFTASASGSYEAVFAEIVYADVTIASNDNEWGTVSGAVSGSMEVGTELTLTATPETDYKFDGWQVDGEVVSTNSTLNLTVIDDVDIIAVFSAIVFYQLNLISSDTECGTISITSASETARGEANNIYPEGTVIAVAATPTSAGKFLNWGDGSLELTRTIYLTENTTLRANFYPATGLILVTSKMLNKVWTSIKNFFSASTGASKIGAPANNALGATTLADVVNSAGQPGGIAILNNSGKVAAADIDGTLANDTTGNAATASVADKIGSSTVGSSTEPVYINAGVPTACGGSLAVDITGNAATATTAASCSGNADTATSATKLTSSAGDSGTPIYFNGGVPVKCTRTMCFAGNKKLTTAGWYRVANLPVTFNGFISLSKGYSNGEPRNIIFYVDNNYGSNPIKGFTKVIATTNSGGNYLTKARIVYKWNATSYFEVYITPTTETWSVEIIPLVSFYETSSVNFTAGTIPDGYTSVEFDVPNTSGICPVSAVRSTGSASKPVYVDANGLLQACTSVDLNATSATTASACSGNAATATKSTQDADGNDIRSRYMMVYNTNNYGQSSSVTFTNLAAAGNAVGMIYHATDNPRGSAGWVHAISLCWTKGTTSNWISQIAMSPTDGTGMWYRTTSSNIAGKAWTRVLDSGNYTSYTVKKDGTGASGSWGISVTGSSASCTGNAATATTASACSGNAASATYATNIRVTQSSVSSWYNLVYTSGIAANTNYSPLVNTNSALRFHGTANPSSATSSTKTYAYLAVGNNTACSNVAGRIGLLRLYGQSTGYTDVVPGYASTSSVTVTLPSSTGTLALTSQIPTAGHTWCTTKATTTSSASSTHPNVVVTNYVNGTAWYRVWSDGWIEQGDCSLVPGNGAGSEYTFKKPFSTNNITITASQSGTGSGEGCSVSSVSTTKMKIATEQSGRNFRFYACGY